MVAKALVHSPSLLILDEPTAGVDVELRTKLWRYIRLLNKQGVTIILTTHYLKEAEILCDRVAVIRKGVLQQIDTPRQIYLYPKNIFVAGFIGSPSMNFVYATVKISSKGAILTFGEDQIFVKDHPESLKDYEGKEIVLGVRPEAFEDSVYANKKEFSEEINIHVSLLEQLGSDTYIHFYKDINPVQTEAIEEILADEGEDISVLGTQTKFIARINPNATIEEGKDITLSINPSKLHFFNPETGLSIN